MWTSERGPFHRVEEPAAEIGQVTLGGDPAAVILGGERRWLPVFSPGGYCWHPAAGDRVVVLKAGAERESPCIVGKVQDHAPEADVIRLAGVDSALELGRGRIALEGTVYLNGLSLEAYIQDVVAKMLG